MNFADSPEEVEFRSEVRQFIKKELPEKLRTRRWAGGGGFGAGPEVSGRQEARAGGSGYSPEQGAMADWRAKLVERGWIAPAWPREYGGAGLTTVRQAILSEEFAEARAPQIGGMGLNMIGPTLIIHGTDEQKAEHLPKIIKGDVLWCQGFSEPGSGSDLASLQTSAVKDGDDYLINGSKIWTSNAHIANWMFMMARTDPEAPKHRGITYFVLDMKSPGISIQPLVQMTGAAEFNQVFFDNVRVPAENVVGELNRGWYVGATTLDFERSGIGGAVGARKSVEGLINWAKDHADSGQSTLSRNPLVRQEIANRYIEAHVLKMLSYRIIDMQSRGLVPNAEASAGKLFSSELGQRISKTAMKMVGLYGLSWDRKSPHSPSNGDFSHGYVQSIALTIAGGTSEIQRNIIAQRGLGMPRE
jgi:alkylation response protein AidB-like acyl-CoA dehydrogenase